MSTDITTFARSTAVDVSKLAGSLADAINESGPSGDYLFVNYSGKLSRYSVGRNKEPMDPEENFLVHPELLIEGWTCWKGGSVVARHEWPLEDRTMLAIPFSQLEDKGPYPGEGDGWKQTRGFGAVSVDDPTRKVKFTTNSASGLNSVEDLMREILKRMEAQEPFFPMIRFADEQFHAQGQWNGKPTFPVDEWLTEAEAMAVASGEASIDAVLGGLWVAAEPAEDEASAKETKKEAAKPRHAAAQAEPAKPAPARRTRRSA